MVSKRSGKSSTSTPSRSKRTAAKSVAVPAGHRLRNVLIDAGNVLRRHWGAVVILAVTLVFFWPLITHMGSYSPGGDAMFNAWEIRRNQNCILHQGCPTYTDANIYYPHKDTMLYSESQLSAGFVTLPLYWIQQNPIFAYNLLTVVSFLLSGWFMYLLARYLSRGNELVSTVSGLVFAFAPLKIAAIYHLQNLSILCLPIAVLFILKFIDQYRRRPRTAQVKVVRPGAGVRERSWLWMRSVATEAAPGKWYLLGLFLALLYVFFASWVQMVFVLMTLGILLVCLLFFRLVRFRPLLVISVVIALAAFTTVPLAKEYIRFSKENGVPFSIREQMLYSTDLKDYLIPHDGTLLGHLYYDAKPDAQHNSYNPDSYSYHGVVLYGLTVVLFVMAFAWRKRSDAHRKAFALIATFTAIGLVGFIVSLGPVLKLYGHWAHQPAGLEFKVGQVLPWYLVDKFLPQLSFIRAIGRASVLVLFALCCVLPLLVRYPAFMAIGRRRQQLIVGLLAVVVLFETMPANAIPMAANSYSYNLSIPKVYEYVKSHEEVNNIIILNADYDYPKAPIPIARAEQVLWAGYHNKNIFNGYSGYTPPNYDREFEDFVDFTAEDIPKLKEQHLDYVLVDKLLMTTKPWVNERVASQLPHKVYEDERYALYKVD
jgi:hypothetical protein